MGEKTAEKWVLAILCLGALYFLGITGKIDEASLPGGLGPRTFPVGIFFSVLVLSGIIVFIPYGKKLLRIEKIENNRKDENTALIRKIFPQIPFKTLVVAGMMAGFVTAMKHFGFILSSVVFLMVSALFLSPSGKKSIAYSILLSLGFTAAIAFFFVFVFDIPIPLGFSY